MASPFLCFVVVVVVVVVVVSLAFPYVLFYQFFVFPTLSMFFFSFSYWVSKITHLVMHLEMI